MKSAGAGDMGMGWLELGVWSEVWWWDEWSVLELDTYLGTPNITIS